MDFEAYLIDKKIDPEAFRKNEPEKWQSFKTLFDVVHPNSFTVQKKFLLNDLRRLYHYTITEPAKSMELKEEAVSSLEPKKPKPAPARPVVKRAPVVKKPDDTEV